MIDRARIGAALRGGPGRSPEVALRYLPAARALAPATPGTAVVEVGCGPVGFAPYWPGPVLGIDPVFASPAASIGGLEAVAGSATALPLGDRSCARVACVDVLEHLPAAERPRAVAELLRVTAGTLVVAVPAGAAAVRQDARVAARHRRHHGDASAFLTEHEEHGLPSPQEVRDWVGAALDADGRPASVSWSWTGGLRTRSALMALWARDTAVDRLLTATLARVVRPTPWPVRRGYRLMAVVRLSEAGLRPSP